MLLPLACLKRYFLKVLQRLSEFVQHYYGLKSFHSGLSVKNEDICPSIKKSMCYLTHETNYTQQYYAGNCSCGINILKLVIYHFFIVKAKFILKAQRHFTDINLIHKSQWPRELLGILFIKSDLIYGSGCKKASNWG